MAGFLFFAFTRTKLKFHPNSCLFKDIVKFLFYKRAFLKSISSLKVQEFRT